MAESVTHPGLARALFASSLVAFVVAVAGGHPAEVYTATVAAQALSAALLGATTELWPAAAASATVLSVGREFSNYVVGATLGVCLAASLATEGEKNK